MDNLLFDSIYSFCVCGIYIENICSRFAKFLIFSMVFFFKYRFSNTNRKGFSKRARLNLFHIGFNLLSGKLSQLGLETLY